MDGSCDVLVFGLSLLVLVILFILARKVFVIVKYVMVILVQKSLLQELVVTLQQIVQI